MRVCLVGGGYWGQKHLRVLLGLAGVDKVVLADPRPEVRSAMLRLYAGTALTVTNQIEQVVEEVDAAVLATPPRTHARLANTFLSAGRHVLVEKPMAVSTAEAQAMLQAAQAHDVTLMVGHTFEYSPPVLALRDLVATGALGRIYYADTSRLSLGLYQHDVNVLWDLAPHDISILNHVLGARPTCVQAWGERHANPRLEDVAHVRLEYETLGVVAQVNVSWLSPRKVREMTVVGSEQMVVYDDLASEDRIRVYDRGVRPPGELDSADVPVVYRYGQIVAPYLSAEEPLRAQDEHFIECARSGQRPRSDGRSGLAVVEVLEAAIRSLASRSARVDLRQGAEVSLGVAVAS